MKRDSQLDARYGRALLSLVSRHRDGAPDLSSVPTEALEALTLGALQGRDIPEPPGETDPTVYRATFGKCRFETEKGPDGEEKRFAVASMRWYGGDVVQRYRINWEKWEYERYELVLEMGDDNVDLSRLDSGAPFLNAHNSEGVADVLGVVVPGSVKLQDGTAPGVVREGVADVRFSRRADVEPIVGDVFDGILKQVSQGFDIYADEWEDRKDNVPLRRVTKWTPNEVSLVPMGAAASAQLFAAVLDRTDRATPNTAGALSAHQKQQEEAMGQNAGTAPTAGQKTEAELIAEGIKLENERQAGIRLAARTLKLSEDDERVKTLLSNTKVKLDDARGQLIAFAAERDDANPTPPAGSVSFGTEEGQKLGAAITRGVLYRYDPSKFKLEGNGDPAAQFAHLSLHEIARDCLTRAGMDARYMSRGEVARRAMRLQSMNRDMFSFGGHTTSDFPLLLADAAGKILQRAYKEAPQKWRPLVRIVNLPDLKDRKVLQMGEIPALSEIEEGGEYEHVTFGENREVWALSKFGKRISITEEMIINDDLDAFARIAAMFGTAGRNTESDIVWGILIDNAAMADGTALFHADHGNLAVDHKEAPSLDALDEMYTAMSLQTGLDGEHGIDVEPRYIAFRPQDKLAVDQLLTQTTPAQSSNVVPEWVQSLVPICERRLGLSSRTSWYVSADPSQIDTIEAGWLQGQEGMQLSARDDFDHDGIEIKAKLRFGAKAVEHRGVFKNAGA